MAGKRGSRSRRRGAEGEREQAGGESRWKTPPYQIRSLYYRLFLKSFSHLYVCSTLITPNFKIQHNQLISIQSSITNVFLFATVVYSAITLIFSVNISLYSYFVLPKPPIKMIIRENKNITPAFSVTSVATHFNMNFPIYKQHEQVVDL
jgi:hypothetical protein